MQLARLVGLNSVPFVLSPRLQILASPSVFTLATRALCTQKEGREGGAKRQARSKYEKLKSEQGLKQEAAASSKSIPRRFSPIRDAFETSQAQHARSGELEGVAALGGLGEFSVAEAQIQKAMNEGQLSNLKGSNKPLSQSTDDVRLWADDAGMKVINRILAANGFKPRSLELKDEMEEEIETLLSSLRRVKAVFSESKERPFEDFVRSDELRSLDSVLSKCNETVLAYNDALLRDMITYGSAWPLTSRAELTLEELALQVWNETGER